MSHTPECHLKASQGIADRWHCPPHCPVEQERVARESLAKPEKCRGCGKWYVPTEGMENVSCTVLHGPGSCCHYSETEVAEPT